MISLSVTDQGREIIKEDPLYALMYALKSSEARRQYPKRLKMLFDYFKLSGLIEEQAKEVLEKNKNGRANYLNIADNE